jgi:ABC-type enterobactin transport system permease subunit
VALAAIHLTQGAANLGVADLLRAFAGVGDEQAHAVLVASWLSRLLAGVLVGAALGVSGAILQTVGRNVLASPDTVAVSAGAYLALIVVTVSTVRLPLLAGSAISLAFGALSTTLLLLFPERSVGLFAWGQGRSRRPG